MCASADAACPTVPGAACRVALTYDMSLLQSLDGPEKFLVTLNRNADIDPALVLGRYTYHHPVYTPVAVAAQQRRGEISGRRRTYFCGAYWRYGFHEDAFASAVQCAHAVCGEDPWR